jgi:hypothetical protein
MVAIAPPAGSVQERYLWLGKHRGSFGVPEAFSFFVWPQTARTLAGGDALATLRNRLEAAGGEKAALSLDTALGELLELDRRAMRTAVRGEKPWATVWAASGSAAA